MNAKLRFCQTPKTGFQVLGIYYFSFCAPEQCLYNEKLFHPSPVMCLTCQTSVGHLQALSVRAQAEAGLPGALKDRPEEAQEEKPGKTLIQVWNQRERGETGSMHSPNTLYGFSSNGAVACLCSDACEKNMTSVKFMWQGGDGQFHTTLRSRLYRTQQAGLIFTK